MNPLPRLLALGLLVVLIALTVVLAGPFWQLRGAAPRATDERAVRMLAYAERAAFPLALTAVVLAGGLALSLAGRSARAGDSRPPFQTPRAELDALARLARTSGDQQDALAAERDSRVRAEADALLNQQRLNLSLEEKIRLGRDLHDGIIQSLYAAGLTIESARSLAKSDPAEADRLLDKTRQNLNTAIRDVRHYIAGLAPEHLSQSTFTAALAAIVEELGGAGGLQCEFKIDDDASARLSPAQSTEALQIAREAISNALRHATATHIAVRLHASEDAVSLLVQDDGRGFNSTHADSSGHGLANMQARAARLGAQLRLEPAAPHGTRVVLTIPAARV